MKGLSAAFYSRLALISRTATLVINKCFRRDGRGNLYSLFFFFFSFLFCGAIHCTRSPPKCYPQSHQQTTWCQTSVRFFFFFTGKKDPQEMSVTLYRKKQGSFDLFSHSIVGFDLFTSLSRLISFSSVNFAIFFFFF